MDRMTIGFEKSERGSEVTATSNDLSISFTPETNSILNDHNNSNTLYESKKIKALITNEIMNQMA